MSKLQFQKKVGVSFERGKSQGPAEESWGSDLGRGSNLCKAWKWEGVSHELGVASRCT